MEDLTYGALLQPGPARQNPARCERAEVTGRLLLAALQALFWRPTRRVTKHDLRTSASA